MVDIINDAGEVMWRTDGSTLARANLRALDLARAQLQGAELVGANLWNAGLADANLTGAVLAEADMRGAHLTGASLVGADCHEANFFEADLSRADLRNASLLRTNLYQANLSTANLCGATLDGAILYAVTLDEAVLTKASLRGADLRCASLDGAQLRETDLADVQIRGAKWGLTTEWPEGFLPKGKGLNLIPPTPPSRECSICGVSNSNDILDLLNGAAAHVACVELLAGHPAWKWVSPGGWSLACVGCGKISPQYAVEGATGIICATCIGDALGRALKDKELPGDATSILAMLAYGVSNRDRFLVLTNAVGALQMLEQQSSAHIDDFVQAITDYLGRDEGHPLDSGARKLAVLACIALGEQLFSILIASINSKSDLPVFVGNAACVLGFGAEEHDEIRSLLEILAQAPEPEIRAGVCGGLAPHKSAWIDDVILRASGPGFAAAEAAEYVYDLNRSSAWNSPEGVRCARRAFEIAERAFGAENPSLTRYLNPLYRALQLADDHASALPYCEQATALARREGDSRPEALAKELNNLGLSQFFLGRSSEAEASLLESARLDSRFPNPHYWLARYYQQRGGDADGEREIAAWKSYMLLGGTARDRCAEAVKRLAELLE